MSVSLACSRGHQQVWSQMDLQQVTNRAGRTRICAGPQPLCMLVLEVEEDILAHSLYKCGSSHSPGHACNSVIQAGRRSQQHPAQWHCPDIHLPAALPMLARSSLEDVSALQHVVAEHGPLSAPHLNHHVSNHVLVGVVLWEQELLQSREVMPGSALWEEDKV